MNKPGPDIDALVRKMGWAPVVFATGWLRDNRWVHVMLPDMPESEARALEGSRARLTYVPAEKVEVA